MWCNEATQEPHCGSNDEAATGNKAATVYPLFGIWPQPATWTQGLKTLHFPTLPPPRIYCLRDAAGTGPVSRSWFRDVL